MPGFMGTYLLADRATGEGESYSFWESRSALEATRSSTDALGSQQKVEIGLDTVSVENFEVIAKTGDKIHATATHARVLNEAWDPAQPEELDVSLIERRISAMRQDPGFLGLFYLADRSSGKAVSVALYDSQANMEAAEERQNRLRTQTVRQAAVRATIGTPRHYEIIARTVAAARTKS